MWDEDDVCVRGRECRMGSDISKCCSRVLGRIAAMTTQWINQLGVFSFRVLPLGGGKTEFCVVPGEPPRFLLQCDSPSCVHSWVHSWVHRSTFLSGDPTPTKIYRPEAAKVLSHQDLQVLQTAASVSVEMHVLRSCKTSRSTVCVVAGILQLHHSSFLISATSKNLRR